VLGTHARGGGFHAKTAGLLDERAVYAAKINANFPGNPRLHGLPTIQGIVLLSDATTGAPLAIMDSIEITRLRTAAASAVAAKYLSRPESRIMTIVGCGAQAASHVRALAAVRPIERVLAFDLQLDRAHALAETLRSEANVEPVSDYRDAARQSDIVITCTPSRTPILADDDLPDGVFVAAVGADSEDKQELEALTLAACVVVADIVEQCATIGELHHALAAGVMSLADVRADLAGIVTGTRPGRMSATERVIFDSTGTALQDVAAASLAYERACALDVGTSITLADQEVV
jgi:ornithine cyclodeaminase/alanine dehydrogenase-like protein (mu-crystallin family)